MKTNVTAVSAVLAMLLATAPVVVCAAASNKPSSHDISWLHRHGPASKAHIEECLECHTDRVSCIQCHKEVAPRNHTPSWAKTGHGLEARWDRSACTACHTEDSCIECHQSTRPSSHRRGWGGLGSTLQTHCGSCHYPVKDTTCFVCHKTAHAPNAH
ncbi:hypothetical protein FO488_05575 [Geobacter sp. FeAm09]|uniref:hypothetical protein n=1 Tax=Geobacter sp. FeAm09 TaxID=2597769 RepID=UPI0011ED5D5A|nr:hypothetical protein [Geobacter sp. FeAm09]QEM67673.1 hypothetical protein FO488_05575 [Geobacter sp. FeAm09]